MKKLVLAMFASLFAINAQAVMIEIYESNTGIYNIAQAEAVIAGSSGADTTVYSNDIWYSDVATNPWGWGAGSAFPGNHSHTFVLQATGTIDTSYYSYLYFGHDDGIEVSVDDSVVYDWNGNTNFRSSGSIYLGGDNGVRDFDLLFWENGGEADLFVWGYNYQTGWEIAQIGDVEVSEPGSWALLGLGLAGLGLSRRRAKA